MDRGSIMKIALVIGHKESSQGAKNANGVTEFQYNKMLVSMINSILHGSDVDVEIVYRDLPYWQLPQKINNLRPDYIISFHCNAFNTHVSGTEVLYYYKSEKSEQLALKMQKALIDVFRLKDRGIKPKSTEDKGGILLRYTNAPCVILEPFFIDNNGDYIVGHTRMDMLAQSVADVIEEL